LILDLDDTLLDLVTAMHLQMQEFTGKRISWEWWLNYATCDEFTPSMWRALEDHVGPLETRRAGVNAMIRLVAAPAELLPGAEAFVRGMHARGVRLAIATNGGSPRVDVQRAKHPEFFSLFETIVAGDEIREPKPDPEILLTAAARLGVKPENALVIDDISMNMPGAAKAGFATGMFFGGRLGWQGPGTRAAWVQIPDWESFPEDAFTFGRA
jgi:HAD superfamily hydrolase (TIGR01509 family)